MEVNKLCDIHIPSDEIFINLHVHTTYSLLDSISRPEDLVAKVKKNNQIGLAVTEHGVTYSAVKMYKLCKQNSLKFIYGCEFYICDDRFLKDKTNKYYHLTVLAKNEQGRLNINKLTTIANIEGFYSKPRIDFKLLSEFKEGLIVMSGCMASELQQSLAGGKIGDRDIEITHDNIEQAKEVVKRYRSVFGEDYYLEVQSHRDHRQQQLNRAIVDLGKEFGIEWVATADSHFVNEEDQELHSIFIQIARDKDQYELQEAYNDTQLQTEKEARDRLMSLSEEEIEFAIRNTRIISDKCDVRIPLSAPLIPHIEVPEGFKNENEYLKHLCNEGWKRRKIGRKSKEQIKKYKERLLYEYESISKMGFSGYFLLVYSYVNSVKRRGIARGSAGGSLVSYLLNITDIDPIKYGLYFERFIDVGALTLLEEGLIKPEELKIPDVDSDFGSYDRDKVLDFIVSKYGKDRVASLGQFGYIWDKSAIKDVGRVLNVPFDITNQITKELGDEEIEDALKRGSLRKWEKDYPKLFDYAKKLAGLPKSFGSHPCGRVVTIDELNMYSSISENDGELVFQMDMNDAEALGLVKCDLLGLKSIDVIYDTLEMIDQDYDYINPDTMNFEDEKILKLFVNGETEGIFQFESDGMKSTLIKMIPSGIEDLSVVNALFRPGSIKYIDNYIKRKHGEEHFEHLHEDLNSILEVTYSIIVYQEQLIEIGRLSGMRNPDEIRQATAKKKIEKMKKVEPELKQGLMKRGWTQEQVDKLWEDILEFAKYSFNKSHSCAYSIIAYIMAFLKVYHTNEFMCSLLTSKIGKYDEISQYINESRRLNISVIPPNINESVGVFKLNQNKDILYGLQAIKGVGGQAVEYILNERENGSFIDIIDFVKRCPQIDLSTTLSLIKSGAFGDNKENILLKYAYISFNKREFKPLKTFPTRVKMYELGLIKTDAEFKDKVACLDIYNDFKKKEFDKEQHDRYSKYLIEFRDRHMVNPEMYEFHTLSFFLTSNPFDSIKLAKPYEEYEDGQKCVVAGTILEIEYKKQRNGGKYGRITLLSTESKIANGMIFNSQRELYHHLLKKGNNLVFLAKKSGNQFIVEKAKTLEEWQQEREKKQINNHTRIKFIG